ncbi:MAG TPA: hypothetical protein VJT78_16250 [Candidatus Dormibacteraeota bacterium]|nr:hypothetical protein [Candidatus Dormibacteraeota bacterium]
MPYWENVIRSFQIPWRHRYLWLVAFFSGEGGGFSFSFSQGTRTPLGTGGRPNFNEFVNQQTSWLQDHIGLIVAVSVLAVVLAIVLFVLSAICEGAVVRGSAEHDAERPYGLGAAWRAGRATMWTMVRFKLIVIALLLPIFVVLFAILVGAIVAFVSNSVIAGLILVVVFLLVLAASIAYTIYVGFLDRLGTRAIVLEQVTKAAAAVGRGHGLVVRRLGRVLLVWLISVAVGWVVAIATGAGGLVLLLPAIILVIIGVATGGAGYFAGAVIAFIIVLPVLLVIAGFVAAQASTYWTLSFRRLDIDYPPPYAFAPPPAPAPAT